MVKVGRDVGLKSMFKHKVARNSMALGVMQIANFLAPLLVFPYLTRVIGIDAFAGVIFTLATIQFAYVITDYGFSLYATYEISHQRENVDAINNIITSIFGAKILLVVIAGLIVYTVGVYSEYHQYENMFTYAIIAVIGQAFQPIWFFQGIEKMKSITIYMVITKFLYVLLVMLFVNEPQDVSLVVLAWAVAQVVGAVIAIVFVYVEGYVIERPTYYSVFLVLKKSSHFFWSRLAVSLFTTINIVVLGMVGANAEVAFFGACDQLYKAGQSVTRPINQALYPYMSKEKNWALFFRLVTIISIIMGLGLFAVCFFIDDILSLIFGESFRAAEAIMIVLLIVILVNYISAAFGYPAFGAVGDPKYANTTVLIGSLAHVIVVTMLFSLGNINAYNIALATLATEIIVATLRVSKILKLQ